MSSRAYRAATVAEICLLALAVSAPAQAQGVLGRADFQTSPFTMRSWTGSVQTLSNVNAQQMGPKGPGHLWNYTHESVGGWNNRRFIRFYWWEYSASGIPEESAGFFFSGAAIEPSGQWQNGVEYFVRARIRFNQRIQPTAPNGTTANNKWFIGNIGQGGDARIMIHMRSGESGGVCGLNQTLYPGATHVGTRISQNIYEDCAGGPLRVGQWEHVQYSFKFGGPGVGAVKLWINNNSYNQPTSQDLNWNRPWSMDRAQMNSGFHLGGYLSDELENDATWDVMDFEIATTFDGAWYPGGAPTPPPPAAPLNVRVIRSSGLLLLLAIPCAGFARRRLFAER